MPRRCLRNVRCLGFASFALLALVGCAPMPQTPAEYRTTVAAHARGRVERLEVAAPQRKVLADLERGLSRCIDGTQVVTRGGQRGVNSAQTYHVSPLPNAQGGPGYAIQVEIAGTIQPRHPPPGGYYMMVIDVAGRGGSTTVTIHGGNVGSHDDLFAAVMRWARGGGPPCPELA